MEQKVRHVKILARGGMLRRAAACCGRLQNPHQQLPESGTAACCGMLLPLVAGGVPMFSWLFPYEGYCLSCVSGCLPVLCRLMFAGIMVALCHVCQVFLLAPHVECLS